MLFLLNIVGTIAFAISGYFIAVNAKLDLLGIIIISYITAFGGGIIRDIIIHRTSFIFTSDYYIPIVFITISIMFLFKLHKHKIIFENNKLFLISDSIGLSVFSFSGAIIALEYDLNLGGVLFLAFITAVGGGILRDIIINKVPFVLKNEFYGTISIFIGLFTYIFNLFVFLNELTGFIIVFIGIIIRLIAIKYKWKLPRIS